MQKEIISKRTFIENVRQATDYSLSKNELDYLDTILPESIDACMWYYSDYTDFAYEIRDKGLKEALREFELDDDITAYACGEALDKLDLDDTAYDYYLEKIDELNDEGIATACYRRFDSILKDAKSTAMQNAENKNL